MRGKRYKFSQAKTCSYIPRYGLPFTVNQKWKNKIYRLRIFEDRTLAKSKMEPRYESRKMVLNQAYDQTEKYWKHFRVAII